MCGDVVCYCWLCAVCYLVFVGGLVSCCCLLVLMCVAVGVVVGCCCLLFRLLSIVVRCWLVQP